MWPSGREWGASLFPFFFPVSSIGSPACELSSSSVNSFVDGTSSVYFLPSSVSTPGYMKGLLP